MERFGRQSLKMTRAPAVESYAAVVGKKEGQGPLGAVFDIVCQDTLVGQKTWEQAETQMQKLALQTALEKSGQSASELDAAFVGDLLNQCIGSSFALRNLHIPTFGLYGACSTMAEALLLSAIGLDGGAFRRTLALTSSHFAASERQYRYPLGYGGQRPPTAQWTVTGAGAVILSQRGQGPFLTAATIGMLTDCGIKDANNMGAAMAPAAYETLRAHFDELSLSPEDYDLIVTGDLGKLGSELVRELFARDGVTLGERYDDCGCRIYDLQAQDVHCGGSGCGCSASVLCGDLLNKLRTGTIRKLLFCGTGALLSPVSTQQKQSIPAVCHAVAFSSERSS